MRQQQSSTLVFATPASALVFGDAVQPGASAFDIHDEAGEQLVHLPSLAVPRDRRFRYDLNGDNCMLRWARVPANYSGPVDVVIHFHGFSGRNAMRLAEKANSSGIELRTPGVGRPTLGLVPHGVPFEWYDKKKVRQGDGFRFPQIATQAQLDAFVDEALQTFATLHGGTATRGRLVLTCHSGGGAALSTVLATLKDYGRLLHGCEYFDATYGGESTLTAADGWLARAIERDARALAQLSGDEARRRYLQGDGSHLRIVFIDGTGTAPVAIATEAFIRNRLAQAPDDVRALLHAHYRAQKVADPKKVYHGRVPPVCGGRLLADPGNDLAPDTKDVPAPSARAHSYAAWDDDVVESEGVQAPDWDAEAQEVTMPEKRMERPAGAPTGTAFIESLGNRKGVERENRIFEQLQSGNIPASLLIFHTVRTSGKDKSGASHEFEYYVTPDVLSIGSESDSVRIPMDPVTAQRVADAFDCLLPTAKMVEQIYQAAPTRLAFIPGNYAGTPRAHLQDASSEYLVHSHRIDAQLRRPPTILTAGHKKEIVISNGYVKQRRNKTTGESRPAPMLAFYGAFTAAGVPIQAPRNNGQPMRGWPSFAHEPSFVDYSHGVRLVWPTMKVDGATRRVADVLKDPDLCALIAAEGAIPNPRYTLDRAGKPATARSQALASEDPLALGLLAGSLGYGSTWDPRIRSTVEDFLAGWRAIPVRVGAQTVNVHPPYYINVTDKSAAASKERARLAEEHRAAAPAALRALIGEKRFLNARIGKSTTDMLCELLQAADAKGLLLTDPVVGGQATPEKLRAFLQHYGLGIDCSGFVSQAINQLVALFPNATAADRIAAPHSTNSAALKGGQGAFERVTDPVQLCGGDTMWLSGHIRILAWAERRGDRILFCTAESRSSNPHDIGPAVAYWRLVPDAKAGTANFKGWRLERSGDLNAADAAWALVKATHVYGHYKPLRKLLQAAGATPTALDVPAPLPSASRQPAPAPAPVVAPKTTPSPAPVTVPAPRTATTRDLTQDEVDRLAAIRIRNAADVEAIFRHGGHTGFIDWYNAGLAHSKPFSARGKTETSKIARARYTAFWNQVRTAFDRDEINALDFAAFTAISINETGGHLWARPESSGKGGAGRTDAQGKHPGLAYFFDRIELSPGHWKASYNHLSSGRTAASLFDDADFIDAHGTLGNATRLAHHGGDFGGAWKGKAYPQADFTTDEDPAVNGFIMQADFYKFRGRGVIQTTGRPSYKKVVDFIKGYKGKNTVLADYCKRWATHSGDVACTRSSTDDWDRIFGEGEMLAKGLSLHAGTRNDYRRMSTSAPVLLDVPAVTKADKKPLGQVGSIYRMGRAISGSPDYGRSTYRTRVLALCHGLLTL